VNALMRIESGLLRMRLRERTSDYAHPIENYMIGKRRQALEQAR